MMREYSNQSMSGTKLKYQGEKIRLVRDIKVPGYKIVLKKGEELEVVESRGGHIVAKTSKGRYVPVSFGCFERVGR